MLEQKACGLSVGVALDQAPMRIRGIPVDPLFGQDPAVDDRHVTASSRQEYQMIRGYLIKVPSRGSSAIRILGLVPPPAYDPMAFRGLGCPFRYYFLDILNRPDLRVTNIGL
jgi:hypothetical protein